MNSFFIPVPSEFSFDQCYTFLLRSPKELLHRCENNHIRKLIRLGHESVLFEMAVHDMGLAVEVLNIKLTPSIQNEVEIFIGEWFDLKTDLKPFYALAEKDSILKDLVKKFYGYRIVGQPDLFESLVWAVLGQQINVQFAYTLKQHFVETFGEKMIYENNNYYLFPRPDTVALLNDTHLLPLQFSRQKSKYTVLIAEAFANGDVSKEKLATLSLAEAKEKLMKIKGVGNWTANYALMKTFHHRDAFPLEDAGIHNAIKNIKGLKTKPTLDQVKKLFKKYKGWEAYATLYLWKSL